MLETPNHHSPGAQRTLMFILISICLQSFISEAQVIIKVRKWKCRNNNTKRVQINQKLF